MTATPYSQDRLQWEDCAAYVLTTVVSTSVPDRVILDGGSKTFSSDQERRHPDSDASWKRPDADLKR